MSNHTGDSLALQKKDGSFEDPTYSKEITTWDVEYNHFWEQTGKRIAQRNLWVSIPCLLIAFSVWFIWSAVAVNLNKAGFNFTTDQLFTLAAMPGLSGATLRIFYSFTVPIFGGRNWTMISTASLLIPAIGIGLAVQDPTTSYTTMLILAALCGLGGGNFSSSMSNISFFFPKREQGTALGLNAGLGNLGVSLLQFLVPFVIGVAIFGQLGGEPQTVMHEKAQQVLWLQSAAYVWILPILLTTLAASLWMNNLTCAKISLKDQLVIFKRKHMYWTTWLYTMSFGSFIGYSAAFPLLIKTQFPDINPLQYAFLGPMVGALVRPLGGWLSDKIKSGATVTFVDIFIMIGAVGGVLYFLAPETKNFWGFFSMFLILFVTTGIANGSVFQMISVIFPKKEAAPVLGFSAAIAAFGAFFIPKTFGMSIKITGLPDSAFYIFLGYYCLSLLVTWWFYFRKDAEAKC